MMIFNVKSAFAAISFLLPFFGLRWRDQLCGLPTHLRLYDRFLVLCSFPHESFLDNFFYGLMHIFTCKSRSLKIWHSKLCGHTFSFFTWNFPFCLLVTLVTDQVQDHIFGTHRIHMDTPLCDTFESIFLSQVKHDNDRVCIPEEVDDHGAEFFLPGSIP